MDDLIAFLRAQLDEDERVALAADAEPIGSFYGDGHYGAVREFLGRWDPEDPAFVLAKIRSDRAILDELAALDGDPVNGLAITRMVRLLAQPYAGRQGWREEWGAQP